MRVRVLGPVSLSDAAGEEHGALERKARELLTVLALRAPSAVGLDELIDLLWDDPPPSATKTVRAHLSRVRSALHAVGVGADVERSGRAAYLLAIAAAETDVGVVMACRERARDLLADGRPDSASVVLAEARRTWRGDPELPDTTAGAALAQGWRRERRQLVEEHLQCLVTGSDPGSALGELERLTAADPLDEPMWALSVRALHRAGRQTEALRAAARARTALVEVGLEPGTALQGAEAEVLGGTRAPDPTSLATTSTAPPMTGHDPATVRYATTDHGHTAFMTLSRGQRDLVVLSPAMITIDGVLDERRSRTALQRLGEHARIACFDRHGIGLSDPLDPQRAPLDQWTADLLGVMDATGMEAPDLLANFDTGLVALEFAARYPDRVRSLVLIHCYATYLRSADYPYGFDVDTTDGLIRDAVSPPSPDQRLDTVLHAAPSAAADDDFRRWWNRVGQRAASPQTAATIRTIATRTDLRRRLPSISAPTLVLHRRSCLNLDSGHARYLAEHLPEARLVTPGGTDSLWFTDSPEVLDEAIAFLRTGPGPR